ncbi:MAG: LPS export ABC transporter permease LptG [Gammaproteobacteria bacterium]|nr:LPS export ABC transporter permease LptG [Gammaproteobacteria bacterium]
MSRYIQRHVYQGTLLTLLLLVSLGLFFIFFGELDDIGRGDYRLIHVVEYLALRVPGKVVQFMPIAVLLGTILSLGSLASNSEIIAMQAAGYSVVHLLWAVLQAALILALLTFLVADWVVPISESNAREIRSSAINATPALRAKKGLWVKDENLVLYIKVLLPNGVARSIEIYQLDEKDRLISTIKADSAIPMGDKWILKQVKQSFFSDESVRSVEYEEMIYTGKISYRLLDVLMIEPKQMSSTDLYAYLKFLRENNLDATVPGLTFWEKVLAPLTVLVMCLLAVPFVLGSQRQSNTGQRLLFGILLGLGYMVADRLLIQLGSRIGISPALNALSPTLLFFLIAVYLLNRKQSHS